MKTHTRRSRSCGRRSDRGFLIVGVGSIWMVTCIFCAYADFGLSIGG